jgi:hypothetical protein
MRDNVAARPHPFPALQRLWQSHISYDSLAAASFSFLSPREAGGEGRVRGVLQTLGASIEESPSPSSG